MIDPFLQVGALVRHEGAPEWGIGQVQSIVGSRVTVNFENAGKIVLEGASVPLVVVDADHY